MPKINYTPILRWKQGEHIALRNLDALGRSGTTPHIVLIPKYYGVARKSRAKIPKKPPAPSKAFVKQVAQNWGSDKFFVDAIALPKPSGRKHPLEYIAASARASGLEMLPSTQLGVPADYDAAVKAVVAADQRGLALRITLPEMTAGSGWANSWAYPPGETDLIIDLGATVATVAALGTASLVAAFQALPKGAKWRSVTISGGNIPRDLSGYKVQTAAQPTPTILPRTELTLWRALHTAGLPYALHFGDYATIGPNASTDDIPGPVPVNAKYAVKDNFLVFHGVKPAGPNKVAADVQLRRYAKEIVAYRARDALAHCWADGEIDIIAAKPTVSASSARGWVSFSVNRHIELTRSQLP